MRVLAIWQSRHKISAQRESCARTEILGSGINANLIINHLNLFLSPLKNTLNWTSKVCWQWTFILCEHVLAWGIIGLREAKAECYKTTGSFSMLWSQLLAQCTCVYTYVCVWVFLCVHMHVCVKCISGGEISKCQITHQSFPLCWILSDIELLLLDKIISVT